MARQHDRGFTLLIVLFALIVMAAIGAIVATTATSDAGTAGARSMRAHALLAAETGLALLTASGDALIIEQLVKTQNNVETALPGVDSDGDGAEDLRLAYVVLSGANGAFVIEGRVQEADGRTIGNARLSGRVSTFAGGDGYEGQVGMGPRGDGVSDERGAGAQESASAL